MVGSLCCYYATACPSGKTRASGVCDPSGHTSPQKDGKGISCASHTRQANETGNNDHMSQSQYRHQQQRQQRLFNSQESSQQGISKSISYNQFFSPNPPFRGVENNRNPGFLRPVTEIPDRYQSIFGYFPFFNVVQSTVFDDVFYSEGSVVISAPTGSGKTVIMELALVKQLMAINTTGNTFRAVYMAPLKALVSERYLDWRQKFGNLGVVCAEVTGDTDHDDITVIKDSQVILTTPEKWDSLTRRWRDHTSLMQAVSLLLIDEVHMLSDEGRGPTLEAVVSRMKTIRSTLAGTSSSLNPLRFVAVSATIPNVENLAAWLCDQDGPAKYFKLDESLRPVKLRRVVLSYPCQEIWSEFRFEISLNYRLPSVIATYSEGKPTLVFVSTRKGAQQTSMILGRQSRLVKNSEHSQILSQVANQLRDNKLRECVLLGVGYHHAGVEHTDRQQVQELFTTGYLPVLVATTTLAMGVNLPAHLVVIKSTMQYTSTGYVEYAASQILQMVGRAGRPQFDTSATAVIMTKHADKV
ncbi:unnamed protein product, partial [Meganyctiphanes norvegica]